MSDLAYYNCVASDTKKVLILIHGEIKTPPMSREARIEAGFLLKNYRKARGFRCRNQDRCRQSVRLATN